MANAGTKTARGLSNQLAPVLEGVLGAVYKVTDEHKARQINKQLKQVIKLAIMAKEAEISMESFVVLANLFTAEEAVTTNGRMEFAAAVSSGVETAEGKQFNVALSAGGSIAGFGISAEGGYASDERRSMYERSSQNLRIRLDWATVPMVKFDALAESIAVRVFEQGSPVSEPDLTEDEKSPVLEALKDYLPVIREIFASDVTPGPVDPVDPGLND